MNTAEISFLVCEQMENADIGWHRPSVRPRVIWVKRTGFQNAFDIFRNGPPSEHFKCLWVVNVSVGFCLPANVNSDLSPSAGSLRAAASFRLSTAWRADRTDRLASPFRRSVVRPCRTAWQSHLSQLNGWGRTWIILNSNVLESELNIRFVCV